MPCGVNVGRVNVGKLRLRMQILFLSYEEFKKLCG
jgi:hypothetical protein